MQISSKRRCALKIGEDQFKEMSEESQRAMLTLASGLKTCQTKSGMLSVYHLKHKFEKVKLAELQGCYTTEACFSYILDRVGILVYPKGDRENYDGHLPMYARLSVSKVNRYCEILKELEINSRPQF